MKKYDVLLVPHRYGEGVLSLSEFAGLPEEGILLDSDIRVQRPVDLNKIMDAIDQRWLRRRNDEYEWSIPARQFGAYYGIYRDSSKIDNLSWDPDQRLRRCVAFSRVVHDSAIGFEYQAKVILDDKDIQQIIPYGGRSTYALGMTRPWLDISEWGRVRKMLELWEKCAAKDKSRINRAIYYYEKLSFEDNLIDVWPLLGNAIEALISKDWLDNSGWNRVFDDQREDRRGRIFKYGIEQLAKAVGISLEKSLPEDSWNRRSAFAHGIRQFPLTKNAEIDKQRGIYANVVDEVYEISASREIKRLVAFVIEKSILEDDFASVFENNCTVSTWLRDSGKQP